MIGPWPAPCPIPAGARVALWADGTLEAAVAAAWIREGGFEVVEVVPGRDFQPVGAPSAPGGWGPAQAAAATAGVEWLVVPMAWPGDAAAWAAAEVALRTAGMGLWRPFALLDRLAVARLGVALGVDVGPFADRALRAALGLPAGG